MSQGDRVLLLGAAGAGKTTFIETASGRRPAAGAASPDIHAIAWHATRIEPSTSLMLGEAPRSDALRQALDGHCDGVVLLLNHVGPQQTDELERHLSRARGAASATPPLVVGITHAEEIRQQPLNFYEQYIYKTNHGCNCVRCTPPVLALDARSPNDVRAVLLTLNALIEMARRYPPPRCRA